LLNVFGCLGFHLLEFGLQPGKLLTAGLVKPFEFVQPARLSGLAIGRFVVSRSNPLSTLKRQMPEVRHASFSFWLIRTTHISVGEKGYYWRRSKTMNFMPLSSRNSVN